MKKTTIKKTNSGELQLFKKETGIPLPNRGDGAEMVEIRKKLDSLVPTLKIGDSFVMKTNKVATGLKHIRLRNPALSFRASKIKDNKLYSRVWRKA